MKAPVFVIITALFSASCSSDGGPTGATTNLGAPGLEQRVTLSAPSAALGDSILVRSVVRNTARVAATVEVGCVPRLHLTSEAFATPREPLNCEGVSRRLLSSGDSLVMETMTPPITAAPGEYTLTVRQLSSPGEGARIALRVLPARVPGTH